MSVYWKITGKPGDGKSYRLGYTSKQKAALLYLLGSGWKKNQIQFTQQVEGVKIEKRRRTLS